MNRRIRVFTDTRQNFQSTEDQPLGLYWENMEVICKLLRFMGFLPYQLNKARDKIETSLQSKLWAIIACIIIVTSVLLEDKERLCTAEYWNSYDQVLESLTRLMFTNTVIMYVSTWCDLPKLVTYINGWVKLTSELTKMSNTFTKSNNNLSLKICLLVFAFLILFAAVVDQFTFLGYVQPLRLFSYFVTVYFSIVLTTFWIANCMFITRMALNLKNVFKKTKKGNLSPRLVRSCLIWLQLQQKTQELTEALKVSIVLHLILQQLSLIFIFYVWMSTLIYRPEITRLIVYTMPLLITTITLTSICVSSNSVTNALGYEYTIELLSLKHLHPQDAREVDIFLETIEVHPTEVVLGGCVTLNRKLIVTLVSTTITYIIVLLQFDVGSNN